MEMGRQLALLWNVRLIHRSYVIKTRIQNPKVPLTGTYTLQRNNAAERIGTGNACSRPRAAPDSTSVGARESLCISRHR
jgi:hypothetical protein